ncbi:hypothetical protein [Salmonella bongori]|uniref:Uncharacterized protein n=1 Tax=Salmonella bongori TaxID=54736 RepID=A0A698WEA6_SALBN|nr:hypothetical protein [Salmonella bongori]EGS1131618.1 hypothetical protein [Salmonella bongori CFSAN000509]AID27546.1 hypothetical protein N643_14910 [Salmonella bongori serovar 48:z41:-- str. RKS3044]EDP8664601.1 hypothetical protein [Salmonella bongori]MBA2137607.1 hypothetical protein [Salmonella bongori serovar 66:z39:-]HDJ2747525.1 hypothetical protein [Salmonella bongori]
MKTLVALSALCKRESYQKSASLRSNGAKGVKNQQTEKKIQKTLVQKNGIPIMRLHRHGGCESLHTNSRPVEEKNPEIQG